MDPRPFQDRHIGPDSADIDRMLQVIGSESLGGLVDETVPSGIRDDSLNLPTALTEIEAVSRLLELAGRNVVVRSMIGMGYYDTITPRRPTQRSRRPIVVHGVYPLPG
jgi:glycine dehydrogenase